AVLFPARERGQAKAEARPAARRVEFPAGRGAGTALDWDCPAPIAGLALVPTNSSL
ncbi:transcriptional regulator, partial [Mesorhizobium waimense]